MSVPNPAGCPKNGWLISEGDLSTKIGEFGGRRSAKTGTCMEEVTNGVAYRKVGVHEIRKQVVQSQSQSPTRGPSTVELQRQSSNSTKEREQVESVDRARTWRVVITRTER